MPYETCDLCGGDSAVPEQHAAGAPGYRCTATWRCGGWFPADNPCPSCGSGPAVTVERNEADAGETLQCNACGFDWWVSHGLKD